jgi:predicted component of type VI protein secretion system
MIISVDGKSDKAYINNFVDNEFLSIDSLAFREYLTSITPDVDMTTKVVDSTGKESEVTIPVTLRFFWPSTGV